MTLLAVLGAVGGVAAALFAMLAWLDSRERQAFTLRRVGNRAILTRAKRPTVQLRRVFVFGHSQLSTADRAGTTEWRVLARDQQLVLALEGSVPDGDGESIQYEVPHDETISVVYRRVWIWDLVADRSWLPNWLRAFKQSGPSENRSRLRRQERELDGNRFAKRWKEWRSVLL